MNHKDGCISDVAGCCDMLIPHVKGDCTFTLVDVFHWVTPCLSCLLTHCFCPQPVTKPLQRGVGHVMLASILFIH